MKRIILLVFGVFLFLILVWLFFFAENKKDTAFISGIEVRDAKINPEPKIESALDPGTENINVNAQSLPGSGTIWQVTKLNLNNLEETSALTEIFGVGNTLDMAEEDSLSMFEFDTLAENKRLLISNSNPVLEFSLERKIEDKKAKEWTITETDSEAENLLKKVSKDRDWIAGIEQKIFLKNSGERASISTQEDYDVIRYVASWKFGDKNVYGDKGYPIYLDFDRNGLVYAKIAFIPKGGTVLKENLAVKNVAQLLDSSNYKVLELDGDENFYTYDTEHQFKNKISKQDSFRIGYIMSSEGLLWPYVFVDAEIIDTKTEGKAKVLLGTSLIL